MITYNELTKPMRETLMQLAGGPSFVDVRSGSALHRRGLAAHWPGHGGAYQLTEAGADLLAKEDAAGQIGAWLREDKDASGRIISLDVFNAVLAFAMWRNQQ
jgi:hypothetical protein